MEIFSKIVELLIGVSWPVVVYLCVLRFRPEIGQLLARLTRIGKKGAEFAPQSASSREGADEPISLKPRTDLTPELATVVHDIESRIIDILPQAEKTHSMDRVALLVRDYSEAWLGLHFERIHKEIYGSQIWALRDIVEGDGTKSKDTMNAWYIGGRAANPELYPNYSLDQWLFFMQSRRLITVSGTDVSITDLGRAFLQYIDARRYALMPAG